MKMISNFIKKNFLNSNQRNINKIKRILNKVNQYEAIASKIKIEDFKKKTIELKEILRKGQTLDDILPVAFSYVREVSKRILKMRHFDVQIIGGIVLHQGKIAEMRTGEGKTLVSTLPAYLNALNGSIFIITVNDYLSERDAQWMKPVYETLGLSVGVINNRMGYKERKKEYSCDIVYGTNNEFGFDYLRDNMVFSKEEKVQKKQSYAIIDEVDSILIDEARTPLVISGTGENNSTLYKKISEIIPHLSEKTAYKKAGDFKIDTESRQISLTEAGHIKIEELLIGNKLINKESSLYDTRNINLMYYIYSGLKAHYLFKKNVDYIVKRNQIIIVDEHTGRTMPGRRWADGLHQSIEAKENIKINNESQTLASITFQNYFKLYKKLAGMTGTADTEAYEFKNIYNLDVIVVPTNKINKRIDYPDLIYRSLEEKFLHIVNDIKNRVKEKRPVLVGTIDISTSEYISNILKLNKIKHNVLNAKLHEKEAQIIAEAGRPSKVTIATNMAGRGTDIVLGGNFNQEVLSLNKKINNEMKLETIKKNWLIRNKEVIKNGGLHIIGTERHESRRIDNQLRGRCARQGDPGTSKFYLSLQDKLIKLFISKQISNILDKIQYKINEPITHPWISKSIENAQKKVENHNFEIRKQLLDFDNVSNEQRKIIYKWRCDIISSDSIEYIIQQMINSYVLDLFNNYMLKNSLEEEWDFENVENIIYNDLGIELYLDKWFKSNNNVQKNNIIYKIIKSISNIYEKQIKCVKKHQIEKVQRMVILNTIDNLWKEHLSCMENLRQTIHLRGYAQKDPKNEYKKEGFNLFQNLSINIKKNIVKLLIKINLNDPFSNIEENISEFNIKYKVKTEKNIIINYIKNKLIKDTDLYSLARVGRNDLCICGSGKKFKHCHGKI